MYDPTCKFLAKNYSRDFAQWLLGRDIRLTQLSASELSVEPIRADALILLQSTDEVLHIEFQTEPDLDMAFRMLDYRLRLYRRFPKKEMRQVVIYLKETNSPLVEQKVFELTNTRHQFEVVKLWEMQTQELIDDVGLLPLAILGNTSNQVETLAEVARKIEVIENRREKSNISAATAILAGLVLKKETIKKLLREDIMKESVIYQEWIETATAEGMARGLAQGRAEGRVEGRVEGLKEGEAKVILKLLDRRFGAIPESSAAKIGNLPLEKLEQLGETLLDLPNVEALTTWLESNG